MSKYSEYDEKLLSLIGNGCNSFHSLSMRMVEENKKFDASDSSWRITDRRLQALRKAGKITFMRSAWYLAA